MHLDHPAVIDDFLPHADALRRAALDSSFEDWHGPDGEVYQRIRIGVPEVEMELLRRMSGFGYSLEFLGSAFRLNFNGEQPNAAIHSDLGWGTHAAVLYLTPKGEGGTAFWRHKATGAGQIEVGDRHLFNQVRGDWNRAEAWEQVALVPWKMNRAVIYPSRLFHSRWPFEAFGTGPEDGRLIAVSFFNVIASQEMAA